MNFGLGLEIEKAETVLSKCVGGNNVRDWIKIAFSARMITSVCCIGPGCSLQALQDKYFCFS